MKVTITIKMRFRQELRPVYLQFTLEFKPIRWQVNTWLDNCLHDCFMLLRQGQFCALSFAALAQSLLLN